MIQDDNDLFRTLHLFYFQFAELFNDGCGIIVGQDIIRTDGNEFPRRYRFPCFPAKDFFGKCLAQFSPLSDLQRFEIDEIGVVDDDGLDRFSGPVTVLGMAGDNMKNLLWQPESGGKSGS